MSNIFRTSFVAGNKMDGNKYTLPQKKVDSMANPTFQPKVSKQFAISYLNTKPKQNTNRYLKKGKPVKPNTGSMDRLNRLKATAMK